MRTLRRIAASLPLVLVAILAPSASAWTTDLATSASASVTVGGALRDTATVTATSGVSPTGTITFKVYGPNDTSCKTKVGSVTASVSGNGKYTSPPITPATPGTYRWVVSYSGDAHNLASGPTTCGEAAETSIVTQAIPGLSTVASGSVSLGEAIRDMAHLSGGQDPTGTITFKLYGPNDPSCHDQLGPARTTTVNGDGEYQSPPVVPAIPGTYRWVASYSGDGDNAAVGPTACTDPSEATVVSQIIPVLATNASAPVVLGGAVGDTARLSGGTNPTGTITFRLFGPEDASCVHQVGETVTAKVNGNGEYSAPPITPSVPGTYRWVASYSGDTDNVAVGPTACTDPAEAAVVSQIIPVLATNASAPVVLGGAVGDTARLSGGTSPTGTITFRLFGPEDASCVHQVGETVTAKVNGNGEYSAPPITPSVPGIYRWVASYSGDTDNAAVGPTACTDPAEAAVVSQIIPVLATHASALVTLGAAVGDTARLSGGTNPTGTITFRLFGPEDASCVYQVGETVTAKVNGNGEYAAPPITPSVPGIYRWMASYSGDTDNAAVGPSACNDPSEVATVDPRPVPGMTIVKTQRLAGSQSAYVSTPLDVTVGQQIDYRVLVTNTGTVPLALTISDPLCNSGTLSGPTGELEADHTLAPGGQAEYHCTHVVVSADGSTITNAATVTGTPPKGPAVGPLSSSVIADVASEEVLSAKSCASGTVTLSGAAGCARRPFKARLAAGGVSRVTFYLDGHKLRTMTVGQARSGRFLIGVNPLKLAYGVHRLTAKITLTCAHKQIVRTLTFVHCRPPVTKPKFTG